MLGALNLAYIDMDIRRDVRYNVLIWGDSSALNVDARRVLAAYIEQPPTEFLFSSQRSAALSTRGVQHIFEKYQALTGIEHLSSHALRHSFCHELVTRKTPLDVVARLAGHIKKDGTPNIQMTLIYTAPSGEDLTRAVEELSWI